MRKVDFQAKVNAIKSIAATSKPVVSIPKTKTLNNSSLDGLSKSIRNKKDASVFIHELKNSLKNK